MKKFRKLILASLISLVILLISLLKAGSVLHYSTFEIDEPYVVRYAVGFLGGDLDPQWFAYHTLPMYLLSLLYFFIYVIYSLLGLVSSKIEFASYLFDQSEVFFTSARILFSVVYTVGTFVLSLILWKKFSSKASAVIFFLVANLTADAILASNYVRVDTFVYAFLALMLYFGTFAPKTLPSFLLSIVFGAAAFASKFPAIVFFPILLFQIVVDVRARNYPRVYIAHFFILAFACVFLFMPYMFLDFTAYKPTIIQMISRASGSHIHIGKTRYLTLWDRLGELYRLLVAQGGLVSLVGTGLCFLYAILKHRTLLFPFSYAILFLATFGTSLTIDSYWLRPVYPFLIFFTTMLIVQLANNDAVEKALERVTTGWKLRQYIRRMYRSALYCLLFGYYCVTFYGPVMKYIKTAQRPDVDSRIIAKQWIQENLPSGSKVWLEGGIPHYFPSLSCRNKSAARVIPLGYFAGGENNEILTKAFDSYYERSLKTQKVFDVHLPSAENDFISRGKLVSPGDYVITSNYIYYRYYTNDTQLGFPQLASQAHEYYAFLRKQRCVKSFRGYGPWLDIYLVQDSLKVNTPIDTRNQ